METPGEQYLDYIGLTSEHPRFDEIARAVDNAIFDAAEQVIDEEKADDRLLMAMLDERWHVWEVVPMRGADLYPGCRVQVVSQQVAHLAAEPEAGRGWERIEKIADDEPWNGHAPDSVVVTFTERAWPSTLTIRHNDTAAVLLPVPFDAATLLDPDLPTNGPAA